MEIDADMENGHYHVQLSTSIEIRDIEQKKQKCIELVNTVQDIKMIEGNIALANTWEGKSKNTKRNSYRLASNNVNND
ncbi:hypothetical protein CEXT_133971 [Caerostris extrusa]|uniref:Uncharacterized protein n=1 Tax=Caerostris extrusa TaxID=172846 RepID=A0AAV4T9P5_CAEEX|nr:hypothetical protein CEXT_133971 [Caerostris extrusa]